MKYTFQFNKDTGICTVRVTGINKRPDDSIVLQQFACDFADENGCRLFLFDMTQAEIIGGTMATFDTGTVPVDPDHTHAGQKIALVYSECTHDEKFLENVAVNRGFQLRVFDETDKALEWLKPKEDYI